jgi:hypothetical protein
MVSFECLCKSRLFIVEKDSIICSDCNKQIWLIDKDSNEIDLNFEMMFENMINDD